MLLWRGRAGQRDRQREGEGNSTRNGGGGRGEGCINIHTHTQNLGRQDTSTIGGPVGTYSTFLQCILNTFVSRISMHSLSYKGATGLALGAAM